MKTIKFTALPTTRIGETIRYCGKAAKFWTVISVVNGVATAKAAGFGTDPRNACC